MGNFSFELRHNTLQERVIFRKKLYEKVVESFQNETSSPMMDEVKSQHLYFLLGTLACATFSVSAG